MPEPLPASVTPGEPALGRWGRLFVVGMVIYSAIRAFLVGKTLGEYGVNPWLFLVIDALSALPLSVGQVRLIQALRQHDAALLQRSLWMIAGGFLAPYAYLLLGGEKPLPPLAYSVIAGIVVAAGIATVWRLRAETHRSSVTTQA